jgi:hypothetical protein
MSVRDEIEDLKNQIMQLRTRFSHWENEVARIPALQERVEVSCQKLEEAVGLLERIATTNREHAELILKLAMDSHPKQDYSKDFESLDIRVKHLEIHIRESTGDGR